MTNPSEHERLHPEPAFRPLEFGELMNFATDGYKLGAYGKFTLIAEFWHGRASQMHPHKIVRWLSDPKQD